MVLGWAMRINVDPGREPDSILAQEMLKQFDAQKAVILIPSIVLAEISVKMDDAQYATFLKSLPERSTTPSFDFKCAEIFRRVWRANEQRVEEMKKANDPSAEKRQLKFDLAVLSIAMAHKASALYTHDDGLRKQAAGHINVGSLSEFKPKENPQQSIFSYSAEEIAT